MPDELNGEAAEKLLAHGEEITLADDTVHRLIFDFEALMHIEANFGIIGDFLEALRVHWKGQVATTVYTGVVAGLCHEREAYEQHLRSLPAGFTPSLPNPEKPKLDPLQMNEYLRLVTDGITQCFPTVPMGKARNGKKATSRGTSSTAPPQADLVVASASSDA